MAEEMKVGDKVEYTTHEPGKGTREGVVVNVSAHAGYIDRPGVRVTLRDGDKPEMYANVPIESVRPKE